MARPVKITTEVLRKLEEGFLMGLSDREACVFADVGLSTLYDYCNKEPEFSERKELLKESVKARAKTNIAKSINLGDVSLSMWYLERKAREEFSTKQQYEHSGGVDIRKQYEDMSEEELQELIAKYESINKS